MVAVMAMPVTNSTQMHPKPYVVSSGSASTYCAPHVRYWGGTKPDTLTVARVVRHRPARLCLAWPSRHGASLVAPFVPTSARAAPQGPRTTVSLQGFPWPGLAIEQPPHAGVLCSGRLGDWGMAKIG